jgi:hypothetical protein
VIGRIKRQRCDAVVVRRLRPPGGFVDVLATTRFVNRTSEITPGEYMTRWGSYCLNRQLRVACPLASESVRLDDIGMTEVTLLNAAYLHQDLGTA